MGMTVEAKVDKLAEVVDRLAEIVQDILRESPFRADGVRYISEPLAEVRMDALALKRSKVDRHIPGAGMEHGRF